MFKIYFVSVMGINEKFCLNNSSVQINFWIQLCSHRMGCICKLQSKYTVTFPAGANMPFYGTDCHNLQYPIPCASLYTRAGKGHFQCICSHKDASSVTNTKHSLYRQSLQIRLHHIPLTDLHDLQTEYCGNPNGKKKCCLWLGGRLIFSYALENNFLPAIILETVNYKRCMYREKTFQIVSRCLLIES